MHVHIYKIDQCSCASCSAAIKNLIKLLKRKTNILHVNFISLTFIERKKRRSWIKFALGLLFKLNENVEKFLKELQEEVKERLLKKFKLLNFVWISTKIAIKFIKTHRNFLIKFIFNKSLFTFYSHIIHVYSHKRWRNSKKNEFNFIF